MTTFDPPAHGRTLAPGTRSDLIVIDVRYRRGPDRAVGPHLVEAPNWSPDGTRLVFNAGGLLWQIAAGGEGGVEGSRPVTSPISTMTM